ncbi:hypothetical protein SFC43_18935 [Bacteroides sp. CR5/BHMF/2]|nr:hypothetical protein [Bacteroides sp. CR5/BHMF/2]
MDNKATIIAGTDIKGTYVKIAADAAMPYTIKRVVTDYSSAALDAAYDGSLPAWLTISSSTKDAGSGLYRHEIVYTVTAHPAKTSQFAITHLSGAVTDENLLAIGFVDPYPGTPLPCLSKGRNFIRQYIVVSLRILCITLWIRRISVELRDLRLILL